MRLLTRTSIASLHVTLAHSLVCLPGCERGLTLITITYLPHTDHVSLRIQAMCRQLNTCILTHTYRISDIKQGPMSS